ncbi:MAG: sigma-70 family RNA polymerase sigma factor [Sandaracinaceae bacterium]|nr:sigma-70 family RNA polymerase sigma factor [Sandaracinaceae bacterium]
MNSSPQSDAALSRYIERVRSIPKLTREDEHDLAVKAKAGDALAREQLINANLRYVVAVAVQYRRYGLKLSDLVAEGNLGLMLAVAKFDPDRGTRFVTYAGYWIRAYVLDMVVRATSMVGAGSGPLRSKVFFRLRRERAKVANLVSDPEERDEMLAQRFNMSTEKMREMTRRLDARDVSLDAQVFSDSQTTMLDTLTDDGMSQEQQLSDMEQEHSVKGALDVALASLDTRERYIVEQRIMRDDEMSLAAIGRRLGVSRERARQLEARAKKKLKKELSGIGEEVKLAAGWR